MMATAMQNLPTSSTSALSSKIETLSTTSDATHASSSHLLPHSLGPHLPAPAFNDASSPYMEQQQALCSTQSQHQRITHLSTNTGSHFGSMNGQGWSTAPGIYSFAGHVDSTGLQHPNSDTGTSVGDHHANFTNMAQKPMLAMQQAYVMKKVREQKDLLQQQQQQQQHEGYFKSLLQISQQRQQQKPPPPPPPQQQPQPHGILKRSPSPVEMGPETANMLHASSLSANIGFAPASNPVPGQEEPASSDSTTRNLGTQERPKVGPAASDSAPPSSSSSLYGSQPRRVAFNGNGIHGSIPGKSLGSGPLLGQTENTALGPTFSETGLILCPHPSAQWDVMCLTVSTAPLFALLSLLPS